MTNTSVEVDIQNRSLMVAQMLATPPEGMGPREWFMNLDELSVAIGRRIQGYVEAIEWNVGTGTPGKGSLDHVDYKTVTKLVLRDDGPGMPPFPGGDFDLTTFVTKIAASGEYKVSAVDGNQGRGFRLAWSAYNPMGIIVYSKVKGGELYKASWYIDTVKQRWMADLPTPCANDEMPTIGDHGTAFVMLGESPDHDTVAEPFPGAQSYKKGGTIFSSMLTRRFYSAKAEVRTDAKGMLVGNDGDGNNASQVTRFFGVNTSKSLPPPDKMVVPGSDLTIEWYRHTGPRWEDRRFFSFGATDLRSFVAIEFGGELFDWNEGGDWAEVATNIGDLSYITGQTSVIIRLGASWKNRAMQSFDREKLRWKHGMRDRSRYCNSKKGYGAEVIAIKSFAGELLSPQCQPQWVRDLIAKGKHDSANAADLLAKDLWEKLLKRFRPEVKETNHKEGERNLMSRLGILEGEPRPDNFFGTGANLTVSIKPMTGINEAKYPVVYSKNPVDKSWDMGLSQSCPEVVAALNHGATLLNKNEPTIYASLPLEQMGVVRGIVEAAAKITLGVHFLFVHSHHAQKRFSDEDVDVMLNDQPGATCTLQRHYEWLDAVALLVKAREKKAAKGDDNIVAFPQ
jgi:hypothetical protein